MNKNLTSLTSKVNIEAGDCPLFSVIDTFNLSEMDGVLKVVIKDNALFYTCFRSCTGYSIDFVNYLGTILEDSIITDTEFYFFTEEGMEVTPPAISELYNIISKIPSFMYNKDTEKYLERNKFLLPDPYIIGNNAIRIYESWEHLTKSIKIWCKIIDVNSKDLISFWRGAAHSPTIDGFYHPRFNNQYNYRPLSHMENEYTEFPRLDLVEMSKLHPNILDAKFTYSFLNQRKTLLYEYESKGLNPAKYYGIGVPPSFHMYYKYLPSLDGTNSSWGRVEWIMLSNSLLIKDKSTKVQWFYDVLEDYRNCIFTEVNESSLKHVVDWCRENDHLVEDIIISANKLADLYLSPQAVEKYTIAVIEKYTDEYTKKCGTEFSQVPSFMSEYSEEIFNGSEPYSVFKYMELFNEKVLQYHSILNQIVLDTHMSAYKDITVNLDTRLGSWNINNDILEDIILFNLQDMCDKFFTLYESDMESQFINFLLDIEKIFLDLSDKSTFESWKQSIEPCKYQITDTENMIDDTILVQDIYTIDADI
jgi:hypothetical protein